MVNNASFRLSNLLNQTNHHLDVCKEIISEEKVSEKHLTKLVQSLMKDESRLAKEVERPINIKTDLQVNQKLQQHILANIGILQSQKKALLKREGGLGNIQQALWKILDDIKSDVSQMLANKINLGKVENIEKIELWTQRYFSKEEISDLAVKMEVTSPVFHYGASIPLLYTCKGKNISPPFEIKGLPSQTQSLAIIMEDIDAFKLPFIHWIAWNIPKSTLIPEGIKVQNQGLNDFGKKGYEGPCPPKGKAHRYYFKFFALSTSLELKNEINKEKFIKAMKGFVLGYGEIMGLFSL